MFGTSSLAANGMAALEYELMEEMAVALGRHGAAVEKALATLADAERNEANPTTLEQVTNAASDAVWGLFVHREACGLRNGDDIIKDYGIPGKVLARLGATQVVAEGEV